MKYAEQGYTIKAATTTKPTSIILPEEGAQKKGINKINFLDQHKFLNILKYTFFTIIQLRHRKVKATNTDKWAYRVENHLREAVDEGCDIVTMSIRISFAIPMVGKKRERAESEKDKKEVKKIVS